MSVPLAPTGGSQSFVSSPPSGSDTLCRWCEGGEVEDLWGAYEVTSVPLPGPTRVTPWSHPVHLYVRVSGRRSRSQTTPYSHSLLTFLPR